MLENQEANEVKPRQKPRMALTRNLRHPTEYVRLMNEDFSEWAYNEERAVAFRGAAHVQMAFLPEVMDATLKLLGE